MNDIDANLQAYDRIKKKSEAFVELLCLDEEERLEVMSRFCRHCGAEQPPKPAMPCQCWNDE